MHEFIRLDLEILPRVMSGLMSTIIIEPDLIGEIKLKQLQDPFLQKIGNEIPDGKWPEFNF